MQRHLAYICIFQCWCMNKWKMQICTYNETITFRPHSLLFLIGWSYLDVFSLTHYSMVMWFFTFMMISSAIAFVWTVQDPTDGKRTLG